MVSITPEDTSGRIQPEDRQNLNAIWETASPLIRLISTVDHRIIGLRYCVTAFMFFLFAGIEAMFMRAVSRPPKHTC